jgi:hypothetical protein
MKSSRLCHLGLLFVVILLAGGMLACEMPDITSITGGPSQPSTPTITMTAPTNGAEFQVGQQVNVLSSASDARGINRVELSVDGVLYRTDPSPNPSPNALVSLSQAWIAEVAGTHTLSLVAVNVEGQQSAPWAVTVRVVGETGGPSVSPTTEGAAPPVPTATYTVTPTQTTAPPPPAPTATVPPPTPTATLNPNAPIIKYFKANGQSGTYNAVLNESVILSWEWERVQAGYLDPGNVPMVCPAMPCNFIVKPPATTTYTLRAINATATTKASVTVKIG